MNPTTFWMAVHMIIANIYVANDKPLGGIVFFILALVIIIMDAFKASK